MDPTQLNGWTSSGVIFSYYGGWGLRVSRIYPRGGPSGGGTAVTVWGVGFRDLGGANHSTLHSTGESGLYCRFGESKLVPATVLGLIGRGGAAQQLACRSPALPPTDTCTTAIVRVTTNGDNPAGGAALSADAVGFTYYD
jgi:hypothetical protein